MLLNGEIAKNEFHMPWLITPSYILDRPKDIGVRKYDISLTGDLRSEKIGSLDLERVLEDFDAKCNFVLGYRESPPNLVDREISTESREDLSQLLLSSKYVLILASPKYFYRHAGTIWEAIMHGCGVIVPNYPVILSQASNATNYHVYNDLDSHSIDNLILKL